MNVTNAAGSADSSDPAFTFPPGAHIHIVGIGGAGMSAIARVLLGRGFTVSGSDRQINPTVEALARDGVRLFIGHAAEQIAGADVLLISSAIPGDNPEVTAARAAHVPVLKRREALGAITAGYKVIAVAGTHGKTTTSALITHLLLLTGHDPTYIVGGTLLNTGTNAGVGHSPWFVIEADEYDLMFLGLRPWIAVITNIEHDHPDMFPTLAAVQDAFWQFTQRIAHVPPTLVKSRWVDERPHRYWDSDSGVLIAAGDDPNVRALGERISAQFDWKTHNVRVEWYDLAEAEALLTPLGLTPDQLPLFGDHNLRNVIGALHAVQVAVEPEPDSLREALLSFRGAARRMEALGQTAQGATIYSDYGHHPTAIRATLEGVRARLPNRSIWAVWQPHTYSRTHLLATDFSQAFGAADHALITDIYAARESPTAGAGPAEIAKAAAAGGHPDARPSGDLHTTAAILQQELRPGDVLIIFSAGDAPQIAGLLGVSQT